MFPRAEPNNDPTILAELLAIPASAVALVQAIEIAESYLGRLYGSRNATTDVKRVAEELR